MRVGRLAIECLASGGAIAVIAPVVPPFGVVPIGLLAISSPTAAGSGTAQRATRPASSV
jgi:hypothetical protein